MGTKSIAALSGLLVVILLLALAFAELNSERSSNLPARDLRPKEPPLASIRIADVALEQRLGHLVAMSWIVDDIPVHTPVPLNITSNRPIRASDPSLVIVDIHHATPPDMLLISISTNKGETISELTCRYKTIAFADQPTHCDVEPSEGFATSHASIPLPPEQAELLVVVQGIWFMTLGEPELTPDPRMPIYSATWAFGLQLRDHE